MRLSTLELDILVKLYIKTSEHRKQKAKQTVYEPTVIGALVARSYDLTDDIRLRYVGVGSRSAYPNGRVPNVCLSYEDSTITTLGRPSSDMMPIVANALETF